MGGLFGGGKTIDNIDQQVAGFQINTATYGLPVPLVLGTSRISGNIIDWFDWMPIAHTTSQSAGKGGSTTTNSTTWTYTTAVLIGLAEGPGCSIKRVWRDKEILSNLSAAGLTMFSGEYGQSPWSYTQSKHPDKALPYSGLAYVAGVVNLGSGGGLPNYGFEFMGKLRDTGDSVDVNPADALKYIINDLDAGTVDNEGLNRFRGFCAAADLLITLPLTDTQKAYEIIKNICKATNTVGFWSQDRLKLVPRCDEYLQRGTFIYQPITIPEYDLDENDFLENGDSLVIFEREDNSEAYNHVTIEFINRANGYEKETAEYKIQPDINRRGLRSMPNVEMHYIHTKERAEYVASLLAMDSLYGRNKYKFKLGWSHCLLEPGDFVTIKEDSIGPNKIPVTIVSNEEDEDGELEIIAKGRPPGIYSPARYAAQQAERPSIDYYGDPGDISEPVIFNPSLEVTQNGLETWIATSGKNKNWGGCSIWISEDDKTYRRIGNIEGPSRHGLLTSNLSIGAAVDSTNKLDVQLIGGDQLLNGTQQDAQNLNTLCWVDNELIAYKTASLTGLKKYSLTYLIRGVYNTPIADHVVGGKFVRMDQALFKYPFTKEQIGKTIYFKFTSYNVYRMAEQDLTDVESIRHILTNRLPPDVSNILISEDTYILKDGTVLSDIAITFGEPTYTILDHYNVYYDVNNSGQWHYSGPVYAGNGCKIKSLPQAKTVKVKITTVNKFTLESDGIISDNYTITGKSDPPPNVSNFKIVQDEYNHSNYYLSWDAIDQTITPDLKGYEVKVGNSWTSATKIKSDPIVEAKVSYIVPNGGNYTFFVKALDNSGNYSNNVISKSVTAVVTPNAPESGSIVQDPSDRTTLVISWLPITDKDLSQYECKLGTDWETGVALPATKETIIRYKISTSGNYKFMVKSKNVGGYYSSALNLSIQASVEAMDVTGFTAIQSILDHSKVRLYWDQPSTLDVAYFEIKKGLTWDVGTVIGQRVTGTFYDVVVTDETAQTFWIKAVNVGGNYSQNPASVMGIYNLNPSAPTNLVITQNPNDRSELLITWDGIPELDLFEYQLKCGLIWENACIVAKTKELRATYKPTVSGDYKFMMKAKSNSDFYSDEVTTNFYAALEPSDVTNFQASQNGESVLLTWTKCPDPDVVGYQINEGSTFDNGTVVQTGITMAMYQFHVDTEITRKFHIKAINRSGKYSQSAPMASVTISNLLPKNVIDTYNEIILATGIHSNTEFGQSLFTFTTLPGKFSDYPTTKFSDIGGASVLKLKAVSGVYPTFGIYTCVRKDVGSIITAHITAVFQPSILFTAGTTATLQYRTSQNNVSWSDWTNFTPVQATFRYVDFRVLLTTADTTKTPEVNQLIIRVDVPDYQSRKTATVAVGGTDISYEHTYYQQAFPLPTAIGQGLRAELISYTLTVAKVRVVNTAGTDVGGQIILNYTGY